MQLELQIHLRVLGACCVVCVLALLYVGRPVSNTVCEHTTDAFCMLKIGWREETMHVEGKKEGWEVPPFSLMT